MTDPMISALLTVAAEVRALRWQIVLHGDSKSDVAHEQVEEAADAATKFAPAAAAQPAQ